MIWFKMFAVVLFMIPLIVIFDWIIFIKLGGMKCTKCGHQSAWYAFLVATMVEIFCFACGIIMGIGIK